MLLAACSVVNDRPEVWTAMLTACDLGSSAPNSSFIMRAKIRRMAQSLCIVNGVGFTRPVHRREVYV
jgi:hypothetical protein